MAYDAEVAERFRLALGDRKNLQEKRMMGGLCFLLNGHMLGGADRTKTAQRRFMFRVGRERHEAASRWDGAEPMIQGGRLMTGLFFVDADTCSDETLMEWIEMAVDFVETLPPRV